MTHTRLWVAATIIAIFILGGFVLSVPHTQDVSEPQTLTSETLNPNVTVRDTFRKGTHTLSGSVQAPNPCTSLSATATLENADSEAERIVLALSMPKDTGICLQQSVSLQFSTTIAAPADTPITVTVNDAPATITLL